MTLEWRSAAEWRALCADAGLTVVLSQSGFEGAPLAEQTGDQVYVCRRTECGTGV
jgi:hypothetical protein